MDGASIPRAGRLIPAGAGQDGDAAGPARAVRRLPSAQDPRAAGAREVAAGQAARGGAGQGALAAAAAPRAHAPPHARRPRVPALRAALSCGGGAGQHAGGGQRLPDAAEVRQTVT